MRKESRRPSAGVKSSRRAQHTGDGVAGGTQDKPARLMAGAAGEVRWNGRGRDGRKLASALLLPFHFNSRSGGSPGGNPPG